MDDLCITDVVVKLHKQYIMIDGVIIRAYIRFAKEFISSILFHNCPNSSFQPPMPFQVITGFRKNRLQPALNNPGQHLQNQGIAGGPDIYCLPTGKGDLFLYIEATFTPPKSIHDDLGLIFPDSAEIPNIRRRRMILPAVTKPLICIRKKMG